MFNKLAGIGIALLMMVHAFTGLGDPVYYIAGGIIFLLGKE